MKKRLIILISMVAIFIVAMIIIIATKLTPQQEEIIETEVYNNYAINETFDTDETVNETYEIESYGYTYNHMENLTYEQEVEKLHMNNMLYEDFINTTHRGETVSEINILDTSNETTVYVEVSFVGSDGFESNDVAVLLYDNYSSHDFTRCVSYDYYEFITSGDNI